MSKPDWKQSAQILLPLLVAAGSVTSLAFLPHLAGQPGDFSNILESLGTNLAAGGIGALCSVRGLWARKEYRETLANHDIRLMIRTAWGESAIATLRAYCNARPAWPPSIINQGKSTPFHRLIEKLKPEDFLATEPTVATIHQAVIAARRALLEVQRPEPHLARTSKEFVSHLNSALVDSVIGTVEKHLKGDSFPDDLREYLNGRNGEEQVCSLLDQLCIYVAYYLKTNPRTQTAILHYTLQEIADRQEEGLREHRTALNELCERIYESNMISQKELIETFEKKQIESCERIERYIQTTLNNYVYPALAAPFAPMDKATEFRFTYRRRATDMCGREEAVEALIQFMGDPRAACWTVISGPAGSGKSRLAAELIATVRARTTSYADGVPPGQWRAGFLRQSNDWLRNDARKWRLDADTLIVIDYASEAESNALADFLSNLREVSQDGSHGQLRVVLIDRLPPDSRLGLVKRNFEKHDQAMEIQDCRWKAAPEDEARSDVSRSVVDGTVSETDEVNAGEHDPLSLDLVNEEAALQIVEAWAGRGLSSEEQALVQEAMFAEPELSRPLFAVLLGDAIGRDGLLPGIFNPISVAAGALDRLFNDRAMLPECLPCKEEMKSLLAAVTVAQGISEEDLFNEDQLLTELTGEKGLSANERKRLKRCLAQYCDPSIGAFTQLEPDFLGELFVLEQLLEETTKKRALERARTLMTCAWALGRNPAAFLIRLAGDFIGREKQIEQALSRRYENLNSQVIEELLVSLLLSGIETDGSRSTGANVVLAAIYYASRGRNRGLAIELRRELSLKFFKFPGEIDAFHMAQAWFTSACTGDLLTPGRLDREDFKQAMSILIYLYDSYPTPDVAGIFASTLVNATAMDDKLLNVESCVEFLEKMVEKHTLPVVATALANVLFNGTVNEPDIDVCRGLANRIRRLLDEWSLPEIANHLSSALANVATMEETSASCDSIAEEIGELVAKYNLPEIALQQAKVFRTASGMELGKSRCTVYAKKIEDIEQRFSTPEIAEIAAEAICNATSAAGSRSERKALAGRIRNLADTYRTPEIAAVYARNLRNEIDENLEREACDELLNRIGSLADQYGTADVAIEFAAALDKATFEEKDSQRCIALADKIGDMERKFGSEEIASIQARALYNATVSAEDPQFCENVADRIGVLVQRYGSFEIAEEQAKALYNASVVAPDSQSCERFADRIALLTQQYESEEIALEEAKAIYNAIFVESDAKRCQALVHRIADILLLYDTEEIAYQEARALFATLDHDLGPEEKGRLIYRLLELSTQFEELGYAIGSKLIEIVRDLSPDP